MRNAPTSATIPIAADVQRIRRREAYARWPSRPSQVVRRGEMRPERAERSAGGRSSSMAGRNVSETMVRKTTPTTANSPRSQMAVMRFTSSEPKPTSVVNAEMTSGSQTRWKARTTTSGRGAPAVTCS
jgi:hypothetical protein